MKYFIQLVESNLKFECVDQHVFDNRNFALADDGGPRYTANWFSSIPGSVDIHCDNLSPGLIAGINRMVGNPTTQQGLGTFTEPDSVSFRRGRGEYLYKLTDQTKWKRAA
jgi:hypothetical protein